MHILISGDEIEYDPCCHVMNDMMMEQDVLFDPETEELFIPVDRQRGIGLTFCLHCGERVHIEHDISFEDKIRGVIRDEMEKMMDSQRFVEFGSTHDFGEKRN